MKSIIVIATAVLLSSCKYWEHPETEECKNYVVVNTDTLELGSPLSRHDSLLYSLKKGQHVNIQFGGFIEEAIIISNIKEGRKIRYHLTGAYQSIEGIEPYEDRKFSNIELINP